MPLRVTRGGRTCERTAAATGQCQRAWDRKAEARSPAESWGGIHPHGHGPRGMTAPPRKALDGEAPQRVLVMVVPRYTPKGCEAGLEMAEEGVGRWRHWRGYTQGEGRCGISPTGLALVREGGGELEGGG